MKQLRLSGSVEKGKLTFDDPGFWRQVLIAFAGKRVFVEVSQWHERRSLRANSRYWASVIPLAIEVLSQGRVLPLSKEQAHEVLKRVFLGEEEVVGPGGVVVMIPLRSSTLPSPEFNAYVQRIEHWLLHDHGVHVPAAGERDEEAI